MFDGLPAMLAANALPAPPEYAVTITRGELSALLRVLSTQVQRPVYEHSAQIRAETAAIEAFLDRAVAAFNDEQGTTPKGSGEGTSVGSVGVN